MVYSPSAKKVKILEIVNNYFGVDCLLKTRKMNECFARQVYIYFLKKLTYISHREIAEFVGLKTHTSSITSIKRVRKAYKEKPEIKIQIDEIELLIKKNIHFGRGVIGSDNAKWRDDYIDIYRHYGEGSKEEGEKVVCSFFHCGKTLTPQEQLFGNRCPQHQKKEIYLNIVDKYISQ